MPVCDYCGKHFTFGALRAGSYKFCTESCQKAGAVLQLLDNVPYNDIIQYIANLRNSNCPVCRGSGPIKAHPSYRVHSLLLYTSWNTVREIECWPCARKRQTKDLWYCVGAGWRGIPWGFIITPIQIARNIIAMRHEGVTTTYRFMQYAKLSLARQLQRYTLSQQR